MTKPMDNKSPEIKTTLEAMFPGTQEAVDHGKCPLCLAKIDKNKDFRDALSIREYYISGMCQKCQDSIWGVPE